MRNYVTLVFLMMIACSLLSCSAKFYETPINKIYDGPELSNDQISILKGAVKIISIDGIPYQDEKGAIIYQKSEWDGSYEFHLLPGPHTIVVEWRDQPNHMLPPYKFEFTSQPNHIYQFYFITPLSGEGSIVVLKDETSGETINGDWGK